MVTEIQIDEVGTVREPNMWQWHNILRMKPGPNKDIAPYAAAVCMTLKQFKTLPAEKQHEVRLAYLRITAPGPMKRAG